MQFDAIVIDYLRQLGDLAEAGIKRMQDRQTRLSIWGANNMMEDLMIIHNRLNRVFERAAMKDDGEQPA